MVYWIKRKQHQGNISPVQKVEETTYVIFEEKKHQGLSPLLKLFKQKQNNNCNLQFIHCLMLFYCTIIYLMLI